MAFVLFILAGLFFSGTIFTYDTCTAYPYYFNNQTNFDSLTFADSRTGDIFQACFFNKNASIFAAFTDTAILTQFGALRTEYYAATPS